MMPCRRDLNATTLGKGKRSLFHAQIIQNCKCLYIGCNCAHKKGEESQGNVVVTQNTCVIRYLSKRDRYLQKVTGEKLYT